ncbi:hypothetical protein OS493_011408 [Desmophyllum pertusum]|uniref:Uncharacterized protein n=1 Tax=Desmophyllum pertusum TaxID=174260 RepID=A0A9W9YQJ2_9CNID|nr:hypothetical protein OS493_011408 [Desmophyllum pertusum]
MNKRQEKSVEGHYHSVAEKYDYFYQEYFEARIPVFMKYLDLKPSHIAADIGQWYRLHYRATLCVVRAQQPSLVCRSQHRNARK